MDPLEHVPQESGQSTLLGAGAHLLVVKTAAHVDPVGVVAVHQGLHGGIGALEVVQAGGRDELLLGAPQGGGHPGVEVQVTAHNVLRLHPQFLGDELIVAVLSTLPGGEQGEHVHLLVVLHAGIHVPVHVDGHVGDEQQVPVDVEKPGLHHVALAHQHSASQRQRPVQPAGADHAAVPFRVQLEIAALALELRLLLHLIAGRVAVGGGDLEVVVVQLLAHMEGNDGRAVAGDVILAPLFQSPAVALFQTLIPGLVQHLGELLHRVEAAGAMFNEVQHFTGCLLIHGLVPPSGYFPPLYRIAPDFQSPDAKNAGAQHMAALRRCLDWKLLGPADGGHGASVNGLLHQAPVVLRGLLIGLRLALAAETEHVGSGAAAQAAADAQILIYHCFHTFHLP